MTHPKPKSKSEIKRIIAMNRSTVELDVKQVKARVEIPAKIYFDVAWTENKEAPALTHDTRKSIALQLARKLIMDFEVRSEPSGDFEALPRGKTYISWPGKAVMDADAKSTIVISVVSVGEE